MTKRYKDRKTLMSTTRIPDLFAPQSKLVSISPVTIDPLAPLDDQIKALTTLINSKPAGSITITIIPKLAEYILTINYPKNRRIKPTKIKEFTADMEAGNWVVNGETIKFADDGMMHDGQNRMRACVRANVAFETDVRFGIPATAFNTIDTGKSKTGDDMLTNAGYTGALSRAAALHWLLILEGHSSKNRSLATPPPILLERQKKLDADGEDVAFDDAIKQADAIYKRAKVFVRSTLTPLLFLYGKYDPNAQMAIVADAVGDKGKMRTLRVALEGLVSNAHRSIQESVRNAFVIITFNAYCAKQRSVKDDLKWSSADPYPALPWTCSTGEEG